MMSGNLWQHKVLNPAVQPKDKFFKALGLCRERFCGRGEDDIPRFARPQAGDGGNGPLW